MNPAITASTRRNNKLLLSSFLNESCWLPKTQVLRVNATNPIPMNPKRIRNFLVNSIFIFLFNGAGRTAAVLGRCFFLVGSFTLSSFLKNGKCRRDPYTLPRAKVELFNNLDHKTGQVPFGQPVLYWGREQIQCLPVTFYKINCHLAQLLQYQGFRDERV